MFDAIDIVIPVYNEGDNIKTTIAEIEGKVKTACRIWVVYDFDEDTTVPPTKELIAQGKNVKLLKNKYGRGVLKAIKTGLETVDKDAVLVAMGDLSDDMAAVDKMFDMLNQGYDLVCGSRYMKGGKQIGGPPLKTFMSRMAGISLHLLTGIPTHDISNSFKLYSRKMLEKINIESTGGFEIGMEIVVKAYTMGYKIGEVPSVWKDRSAGESKFMLWKWLPKYLHWYWFAVRHRFLGRKDG